MCDHDISVYNGCFILVMQLLSRVRIMEERLSRAGGGGSDGAASAESLSQTSESTDLDSSLTDKSMDQLWEIIRYKRTSC